MTESDRNFASYDFPAYPGAQVLCNQRVYAQGGRHLNWHAFTSRDAPDQVVAWYTEQMGTEGLEAEAQGALWRISTKSALSPDRVLHVLPVGAPGPHRNCGATPPDDAQSVIIVSRMSG